MGLLSKILTAIRGTATEAGQSIVDANAITILKQEVRDAEKYLAKAKQDLTSVIAKEMQAKRKIDELSKEIEKHEGYVSQALEKGDENLALEIAQKMAEFEEEKAIQQKTETSFSAHSNRLKDMVKKTSKSLTDMKRQVVMVETTDSVQKATKAITENYASGGSKMLSAKESLDRIQQRQQDLDDRLEAGEVLEDEFEGTNLEDKLREAGIGEQSSSANDILAKIKAKKAE